MDIKIKESAVGGSIEAPSSKSATHRAYLCALLAGGTSSINAPSDCDDALSTLRACEMLGAKVVMNGNSVEINGTGGRLTAPKEAIDCGESASTLRMLMAISAFAKGGVTLTGKESLRKRPVIELDRAMSQLGVRCRYFNDVGYPPVMVKGDEMPGGEIGIRGDVSSQYVSSLLLACPLAKSDTNMNITTKLESMPYVKMTIDVQGSFGINIGHSKDMRSYHIASGQRYMPSKYIVEGDYSSAAFLLAAGALGGKLRVTNLKKDSTQGDSAIVDLIMMMGGDIEVKQEECTIKKSVLHGMDIDCRDMPDLVPILAVLCTQADGLSRLRNIERLRIKESDRIESTMAELRKMGADIRLIDNTLEIKGPTELTGAVISSHNDHRIAMAAAVAAINAKGASTICDIGCISKSYPGFLEDMKKIGVDIDVI